MIDGIRAHLDALAKPRGAMGRLEALAIELAQTQQRVDARTFPRRAVLFAADHGCVGEGVSAWPSDVTQMMVATIMGGRATSNALAAAADCPLRLVDVGMMGPRVTGGPRSAMRGSATAARRWGRNRP
ncbi:nicotinate-nucleotide--dimethylbenzimidazole phosphoribosyltransferase [Sphingomonas hankookensis]|uniref:nicotinate-nucleotide--dimethylbenzimidazole phosphoribosyltransferase n=1 Tax=Sphingomonas hankookensis TaxID=563996 RepID=UPI003D302B88